MTPNNPYPDEEAHENVFYGSFSERPKYLDPARSYSSDESVFTGQIYEPPLQFAYLPGVYELIPATAAELPLITTLYSPEGEVAETIYRITLKPGIFYQPHPAFAEPLKNEEIAQIKKFEDFKRLDTRELVAEDYVYQIKRLASPAINSPIYELMADKIIGLKSFHDKLLTTPNANLRELSIEGVKSLDKYTYEIRLKGVYPQFSYWLALQFFAPMPWEAEVFYDQLALKDKNIILDWYPIGTGPFMMQTNNPNKQIVLVKNPNFRQEYHEGELLPQITKAVYTLEKEAIPTWSKFLQGYYDLSGIGSDNFATAIQTVAGQSSITPALAQKGISLIKEIMLSSYYWGFNMNDPVLGGLNDKSRKLRQAIGAVFDVKEYISIFLNERGLPAEFILPPGLFGYQSESNPFLQVSLDEAKQWLADAGYPQGRDARTGDPLIIHFDTSSGSGSQNQARDNWTRKQFKKLGIDLDVRATDYNRFREKLKSGHFQFFFFGWSADYPDPENFLFLLYGPNGRMNQGGVNSTNYDNPQYNALFEEMAVMPSNQQREELIHQMRAIAIEDAPMVWGFNPESYLLKHEWMTQVIPNQMVRNALKYYRIDAKKRAQARRSWNQPSLWPFVLVLFLMGLIFFSLFYAYWNNENRPKAKRFKE